VSNTDGNVAVRTRLPSWRRSADRTHLQVDALPLGIFEQDLTESFVQQKSTLLGWRVLLRIISSSSGRESNHRRKMKFPES
jgi:hypothetical protein